MRGVAARATSRVTVSGACGRCGAAGAVADGAGVVPGCGGAEAVPGAARRLRRGFRQLGLLLRGALLFHLRDVEEILPADQHEAGQNDGEDGVAIIGHRSGLVIQIGLQIGLRQALMVF